MFSADNIIFENFPWIKEQENHIRTQNGLMCRLEMWIYISPQRLFLKIIWVSFFLFLKRVVNINLDIHSFIVQYIGFWVFEELYLHLFYFYMPCLWYIILSGEQREWQRTQPQNECE